MNGMMMCRFKILLLFICFIFSLQSVSGDYRYVRYTSNVSMVDMAKIKPKLMEIISFSAQWCYERELTFMITSLMRSEKRNAELDSVSNTHPEGRAFDMSVSSKYGWNKHHINEFKEDIENKFGEYGAISLSDGKRRVIVSHDNGNGYHIHIQIAP